MLRKDAPLSHGRLDLPSSVTQRGCRKGSLLVVWQISSSGEPDALELQRDVSRPMEEVIRDVWTELIHSLRGEHNWECMQKRWAAFLQLWWEGLFLHEHDSALLWHYRPPAWLFAYPIVLYRPTEWVGEVWGMTLPPLYIWLLPRRSAEVVWQIFLKLMTVSFLNFSLKEMNDFA